VTKKELSVLKEGDSVLHKHYGKCVVTQILNDMGPVLKPQSDEGKLLLHFHSHTPIGTPVLDSFAMIRPLNRPFKEENKWLIKIREQLKRERGAENAS